MHLDAGQLNQYSDGLQSIANDCRDDQALRARVDADPGSVFAERGMPYPEDTDVRVVRNTNEVFYLTMPPDPNVSLSDSMVASVAGGSPGLGRPGNCASTSSTIPSCLGTYGSATGN